jgi:hypothetical protein
VDPACRYTAFNVWEGGINGEEKKKKKTEKI